MRMDAAYARNGGKLSENDRFPRPKAPKRHGTALKRKIIPPSGISPLKEDGRATPSVGTTRTVQFAKLPDSFRSPNYPDSQDLPEEKSSNK